MKTMREGMILFGHGARDPRWADTIEALAQRCRELAPDVPVACAFLEFMTPDLAGAVAGLVQQGVQRILVAPMFLASGGHVLRDLPDRLASIAHVYPGLTIQVGAALGGLPEVIDAMAHASVRALSDTRSIASAGGEDDARNNTGRNQ